jgi:hypothetical protein
MKRVLLLSILFCISFNGFANRSPIDSIHIVGFNIDKELEGQEVRIQYFQNYRTKMEWPPSLYLSAKIIAGKFELQFKPKDSIGYILFSLPSGLIDKFEYIKVCLVEPGDQMIMDLKDSVHFLGKSSFKFQMQYDLAEIKAQDIPNSNALDSVYLSKYFDAKKDAMLNKRILLKRFESRLTPKVYNVYKLNMEADVRESMLSNLQFLHAFSVVDSISKSKIQAFYKSWIVTMTPFKYSDDIKLESSTYNDYLLELEKSKLYFGPDDKNRQKKIEFRTLFNNVNSSYKGPIRDRLIL